MNTLATAMTRAAESEAFMSLASEVGFTVAPLGVEAFEALLAAEDEKVANIVRDAGLGTE